MSNVVRNISELAPNVPDIVITEPSPLSAANVSMNPTKKSDSFGTPASPAEPSIASETSSETQSTTVAVTPTLDENAVDTSGFKPAEDCGHASVTVDEQAGEVSTMDGRSADVLASRNDIAAEDNFRSRPIYDGAFEYLLNWPSDFINSKYVLPIQILLLALPISAGFMGARYMDKCPMSNATPIFLFMMGVAGCLVIFCRMLVIVKDTLSSGEREWTVLSTIAIFGNYSIVLFLCTEIVMFFRLSPNFQPGMQNYCDKTFYTYTYWMNWVSIFLVLIIAALHAPKCRFGSSRLERDP